jgi:hypothetical protein
MRHKSTTAAKKSMNIKRSVHFSPLHDSLQFLHQCSLLLIPDLMARDIVESSDVMKMNGGADEPLVRAILFINILRSRVSKM